jgi:type 1 glutamine amidotransferase
MRHAARFAALLAMASIVASTAWADSNADATSTAGKKIVFIAGHASHGYGQHEYAADCQLWAKMLEKAYPGLKTALHEDGWPNDPKIFDGASAIVVFADGGGGNPMLKHLDEIDKIMKRGVGLACIHYTVEIPKGRPGDRLNDWIGGHYEQSWSINPWWNAEFKQLPNHPIARGVKPFAINDEWYYHMRFIKDMEGVTPILTAVPPNRTREGKDGPHSGNPTVRAERDKPEHVAWARVRPDGGRGFGFTGGHIHWNFANDNYRTVVLNGIAWTAKLGIPAGGVPSDKPTFEELAGALDKPQPANFNREQTKKMIDAWK